jgi:hypothetical protein
MLHSKVQAYVDSSRSAWKGLLIGVAFAPVFVYSQDKSEIRSQAKTAEAQLRQSGEPMDRCSLGAFVADGGIVSRTFAATGLSPGDRLLTLNHLDVAGKAGQQIIGILRTIEPSAVVPVTLDRAGQTLKVDVTCSNAREGTEAMLAALNFAARGKFDECVSAFSGRDDLGSAGAALNVQCAAVSRKSDQQNVAVMSADLLRMMIEDAKWVPAGRAEVIKGLRAGEGMITQRLGAPRFQQLVAATRSWPGGEDLFDATAPDWGLFRRNAESALRARLFDPESARIEWPHGFMLGWWRPFLAKRIDGYWTCGSINARNRMGGYVGSSAFVVVLSPAGAVQYVEVGESKEFDMLTTQCETSAQGLPPPPPELSGAVAAQAANTSSLADELKKLVDLKNSGALTEEEFQAAKQKLLGTSPKQ